MNTRDFQQQDNAAIQADDASVDTLAQGLTRRDFLVRAAAGGGLMIGYALVGTGKAAAVVPPTQNSVTAWITIGSDDSITVQVAGTEMGQGILTGLAQIAADELQVDWSRVQAQHAPVDAAHGGTNASPWGRFTGGSLGIRLQAPVIRQAAANARALLIQAAATQWGVSPSSCSLAISSGTPKVTSVVSGSNSATYGSLAASAATQVLAANAPVNTMPVRLVGTSAARLDIPAKVTGAAQFGIDVAMPGLVFASVKHAPVLGATVKTVGTKPAGALAVVKVGPAGAAANGVAVVVASTTWDAVTAARGLSVTWTAPASTTGVDSTAIANRAAVLMASGTPITALNNNWTSGLPAATVNSTYQLPFLAHATMEPLNCTVRYTAASGTTPALCELWAPTQGPDAAKATAAALCPAGTVVKVVNTLLGSGFGRKYEQDFIREAVQVGLAMPGVPVKMVWSREEDFANDLYRPMALSRIQASAESTQGRITQWNNRIVTPSIAFQRGAPATALDGSAVDGAANTPYNLSPALVEYVRHDATVPVGYWRSVGMSINTFAVESAMDELAASIGWDPIQFRLANTSDARLIALLNALRTLSNWGSPAAGYAQGVAVAFGFGSYVGQVAEVKVTTTGVSVRRVSTVIDCGVVINPDMVRAQVEGAVSQGMAAALYVQQTFTAGVAQSTNFSKYRLIRLSEMPQCDVQIIAGQGYAAGGVGEVGMPCVAPAIANACAKFSGAAARRRSLPFFPGSTLSDG
jgi:isoquinoline 1-oxidoreductase beta subunit